MKSGDQRTRTLPLRDAGQQTLTQTSLWQRVALAAYSKTEARGFNPGHELEDWLEAERKLTAAMIDEELAA